MQAIIKKLAIPLVAIFMLTACGVQSYVERDPAVDIGNYRTYAWIGDKDTKRSNARPYKDFQESQLMRLVEEQLEKNGFVRARSNPDILIDYDIMIENEVRQESDPVYSRPFVRYYYNPFTGRIMGRFIPSMYMGQSQYDVPYKSGTITINIVDNKSNKLVWQGWAETDVTRSKRISKEDMNRVVKSIFRKLDVAKN